MASARASSPTCSTNVRALRQREPQNSPHLLHSILSLVGYCSKAKRIFGSGSGALLGKVTPLLWHGRKAIRLR
jgi:hypothetical protein